MSICGNICRVDIRGFGKQVLQAEQAAIAQVVDALDDGFEQAVGMIHGCAGTLLVTGVGKAGHVARKVSATFASTGTASHFLSTPDAVHGDLGAIREHDIVLLFSASGESDEILRLMEILKRLGTATIAVTAGRGNSLGRLADAVCSTGRIAEACPLGLAPTASTTAMLALGRGLCPLPPGGAVGQKARKSP